MARLPKPSQPVDLPWLHHHPHPKMAQAGPPCGTLDASVQRCLRRQLAARAVSAAVSSICIFRTWSLIPLDPIPFRRFSATPPRFPDRVSYPAIACWTGPTLAPPFGVLWRGANEGPAKTTSCCTPPLEAGILGCVLGCWDAWGRHYSPGICSSVPLLSQIPACNHAICVGAR